MGALGAIRQLLKRTHSTYRSILFGFGVVMPYTTFSATGPEIIPDVLLDRRSFRQPLLQYVKSLKRYWEAEYKEKHGKEYRGLTEKEIREVRQVLRPDLETAISLGGYLSGLEDQQIHLTNEQIRASRRMAANPRTVVRGAAGTGKSVIALDRALQEGAKGLRVLYLCFNRLLAAHVKTSLESNSDTASVQVYPVHVLYHELIKEAGLLTSLRNMDENSSAFFSKTFPELAAEALCETTREDWDVLVVDEAQDLLTPEHLDVFDLLLGQGLSCGRWHLFLDPHQNIYGDEIQKNVADRLNEYMPAYDDLFENCRNTRQIAVQTSIISGIDLPFAGATNGPEVEIEYYSEKSEAIDLVENLVRLLVDSQIRPDGIAVLSTRRFENSILSDRQRLAGFQLIEPTESMAYQKGTILFSTMHAFKGLESQAVIAIDMDEIGDEYWSMLHYTGLSRARTFLRLLLPKSARSRYDQLARSFGNRLSIQTN